MSNREFSELWLVAAWDDNLAIWNNREWESPNRVSEAFEEMLKAVQGGALKTKPTHIPTGKWSYYPEGHELYESDLNEVLDADAYSWDPNDFVEE